MNEIHADDKTVRQVLDKVKYIVDFFQREYRWQRKHIEQLIDDLSTKFITNYKESHERPEVQEYELYYLGPIVLSQKKQGKSIIDGQQRLTSLTLLLIYLNNLQKERKEKVDLKDLIYSERFSIKSFNIQDPDRLECIQALYNGEDYDPAEKGESVKNIVESYKDIEEIFPEELKEKALPYFIDWLIDKVIFVEIITYSDDDAYTIFETMNDRGLSLTPAEMLKGFLLSNVIYDEKKYELNDFWRDEVFRLKKISKNEDLEFFRAWLRAKYADSIRPGRKGAFNEDFEKIGTRFHSWVKDNRDNINLKTSGDYFDFVMDKMKFYVNLYEMIDSAAKEYTKGLEGIFYIEKRRLATSIYFPLLMAPIKMGDDEKTIRIKLDLVSKYLEIFVVFRSLNYRNYAHSGIRYTMYSLVKDIRDKDVEELAGILKQKAKDIEEGLDGVDDFEMHGQNKWFVKFILARITNYIEEQSKVPDNFATYMNRDICQPFQVEHIWADNWDEHKDEFEQKLDFEKYRNKLGALILLPEDINKSLGALPYKKKLTPYFGQNFLAKSLSPQRYTRAQGNSSFLKFVEESGLPFKPHKNFNKIDVDERQQLYKKILEKIYDLKIFGEIANR